MTNFYILVSDNSPTENEDEHSSIDVSATIAISMGLFGFIACACICWLACRKSRTLRANVFSRTNTSRSQVNAERQGSSVPRQSSLTVSHIQLELDPTPSPDAVHFSHSSNNIITINNNNFYDNSCFNDLPPKYSDLFPDQ